MYKKVDRLCGLVVRVPGYKSEIYCVSFEVLTASVVYWSEFLATDPEVRVRFPAPPDFLSTIVELLGKKSRDSGLENREYGRRDPSR
jgi:hypothetical protein